MKIQKLRKTLIANLVIALILFISLIAIIFYLKNLEDSQNQELKNIQMQTVDIIVKTSEIESKMIDIRKYREIWNLIGENKKIIRNVKIEEINKILDDVAKTHNILGPKIQLTMPQKINNGNIKKKSFDVFYSSGILEFVAFDDVLAVEFIEDFSKNMPGYLVITLFEIEKVKDYSMQDLSEISKGTKIGAIKAKINFIWYNYRGKEKL